ncbi:centrosomal protein of 97 kDa [Leptidea sinapis]|uniref:centrosomal protein of 97 kDa n=1 Tax=Leptidea sinapis TaxID=189913 RepID=UPI0021C3BC2B|nr:centrosomal protein of 97 kDa [Leptidea sinapis]
MDSSSDNGLLDLSRKELKKIEKLSPEKSKTINNLILDQNELQRLDNLDTYLHIQNLSICNNFLVRMHGVARLTNLRVLSLNNNGILQIEGLKEMLFLKVLKLAGNNIKSIEHLNHNIQLEHLDLSNNQISFIADISYLKNLKNLSLERNRITNLRQCDRYLPSHLTHLGLAHNNIQDLNEISHLVHLTELDSFTIQGNPCVAVAAKDKLGFDYRPFVLNWMMSVKLIDGFAVSAIESLKAEWLYSQGKGRYFHTGQNRELCEYLASTCPLTADALETEDQRKLRLILSKAQHHQQQLKDQNHIPLKSKMQSPRMQARMTPRHMGRSPDRLSSSFHASYSRTSSPSHQMSLSCSGELPLHDLEKRDKEKQGSNTPPRCAEQPKPSNQPLEAASKMVPVPESLMSPDYQDPIYDIQKTLTKTASSEPKIRSLRSPKCKSANSSPKLRSKIERNGKVDSAEKLNGDLERLASNQRRQKRLNEETVAAITIQRMWRGYRSRNLNKDTIRILHAIQAARARQHIQRLTSDMEATKAALESERKIQQLQMQAINALWKKVSTLQLQPSETQKQNSNNQDNSEVLRRLTETCSTLQTQVEELRGCMREVLSAVRSGSRDAVATQTDISAVATPQEERWLRRPQSLPLTNLPSTKSSPAPSIEKDSEIAFVDVERTESLIEEKETPDERVSVMKRELIEE